MRKYTLAFCMEYVDVARCTFESIEDYTVTVKDQGTAKGQYQMLIAREELTPHIDQKFDTLDEIETYLDGTMGYTKGARVWEEVEEE